jgi:hypothetical protein
MTWWDTLTKIFDILFNQGVIGALLVLFIVLWMRISRNMSTMARSFNRQIAKLNEQRGEEIRLVTKALQANSDNNLHLSNSLERLRDFIIEGKLHRDE